MGICALSRLITAATPWKVSAGRLYCTAAALGISVLHWPDMEMRPPRQM